MTANNDSFTLACDAPTVPVPVMGVGSGALFDLPGEGLKRQRVNHRAEVRALKKEHGIFTHLCRGAGDWLALSMPECTAALAGYDLTDEEKTDAVLLLAGYCRLLDEAGLVEDGHETERAAVAAVVERLRSNIKGSQPAI